MKVMKKNNLLILLIISSVSFIACSSDSPIIDDSFESHYPQEVLKKQVELLKKIENNTYVHEDSKTSITFTSVTINYSQGKIISAYCHATIPIQIDESSIGLQTLSVTIRDDYTFHAGYIFKYIDENKIECLTDSYKGYWIRKIIN